MSAVRLAVPTLLGIEQPPQAALRGGRSSYRSRCAGGRSMIASLGAAASPASSGATGGACQPHDASWLATRADMSTTNTHEQIAKDFQVQFVLLTKEMADLGVNAKQMASGPATPISSTTALPSDLNSPTKSPTDNTSKTSGDICKTQVPPVLTSYSTTQADTKKTDDDNNPVRKKIISFIQQSKLEGEGQTLIVDYEKFPKITEEFQEILKLLKENYSIDCLHIESRGRQCPILNTKQLIELFTVLKTNKTLKKFKIDGPLHSMDPESSTTLAKMLATNQSLTSVLIQTSCRRAFIHPGDFITALESNTKLIELDIPFMEITDIPVSGDDDVPIAITEFLERNQKILSSSKKQKPS